MRHRAIPAQMIVLYLVASLLAPLGAQAQQGDKLSSDTRMQDLINSRRSEHWNFWETQLALTPAPRLQPVEALPEWYPTGTVVLTLDEDYIRSFQLNKILRTENKGTEISEHDPRVINHIKAITCNTLHETETQAAEMIQHDPEANSRITELCKDLPNSAKTSLTMAVDDADDAHSLAQVWLEQLKEDKIVNVLSFAHTLLKILKDLTSHTNVLILVPGMGMDEDGIYERIDLIKEFPGAKELLSSSRINFVQVPVKTKWIRDYGPIFIRNANKEILCVDPRYQTDRESLQEQRELDRLKRVVEGAFKEKEKLEKQINNKAANNQEKKKEENSRQEENRLLDDVSPSLLAGRLRQRDGTSFSPYPINVVRPPLALDGGDFFTDGNGVGFTSTETLRANGGNVELVNQVFREYLGINEVVYLLPLPGSTVKHIDMFFKPVNEKILLLGKYENGGSGFGASLQHEAQRVLSYNLQILKDFYENRRDRQHRSDVNVVDGDVGELKSNMVNIVLVPMPELERPVRERMAKYEQELSGLVEKYKQQYQSYETAVESKESLEEVLSFAKENQRIINSSLGKLRGVSSADDEVIRIDDLLALSDDVAVDIKMFYEERRATISKEALEEKLKPWKALTQYLDSKSDSKLEELEMTDKQSLRGLLNSASSSLALFILTVQIDFFKAKQDYARHLKDLTRIENDVMTLFEEREKLQERYPYGSDLYRTFLNALQIRTGQANLLMTPVYRGIGEMENRVQNIFRRVYTQAYGNVTIIPVDSDYFIQLSGSIHCLTQAIPVELDVFQDDWSYKSKLGQKP